MRAKFNSSCMTVGAPSQPLHGTEFRPSPITPHHPTHNAPCYPAPTVPRVSSLQRSLNPAQLHPQHCSSITLPINPNLNLYLLGLPNTSAHPEGVNPRPLSSPATQLSAQHAIPSSSAAGITLGFSGSSSHIRKAWAHGQNQLLQTRNDLRK